MRAAPCAPDHCAPHGLPAAQPGACKLAWMQPADPAEISQKLAVLRVEHRDLDTAIANLQVSIASDELTVKRLKRRKLQLKDLIARLESALIPDEPA